MYKILFIVAHLNSNLNKIGTIIGHNSSEITNGAQKENITVNYVTLTPGTWIVLFYGRPDYINCSGRVFAGIGNVQNLVKNTGTNVSEGFTVMQFYKLTETTTISCIFYAEAAGLSCDANRFPVKAIRIK